MDKQVYQRHCISFGHQIVTMVISEVVEPKLGMVVREVQPRCVKCAATLAELEKPPRPMRKSTDKKKSRTATPSDPMESPPGE